MHASEQAFPGARPLHASCHGVISGFGLRTFDMAIDAAHWLCRGESATLQCHSASCRPSPGNGFGQRDADAGTSNVGELALDSEWRTSSRCIPRHIADSIMGAAGVSQTMPDAHAHR